MADQVKVDDLAVFGQFRVALLKFAQAADLALTSAEAEIVRTRSWLEGEQRTVWEGQLRKRMEAVTKAKDAVRQKTLYKDATGRGRSAVEEEKTLARCEAAVEEAQRKIAAVRKWGPRLEKEASFYHGGVGRLGRTIAYDVPRAVALLDRLAGTLEEYVQMEAPGAGAMARGEMAENVAAVIGAGDGAEVKIQKEKNLEGGGGEPLLRGGNEAVGNAKRDEANQAIGVPAADVTAGKEGGDGGGGR